MAPNIEGKCVAVLCDNDLLYKAIKINLDSRFKIRVFQLVAGAPAPAATQAPGNGYDLIVVAQAHSHGEPLLALARASLLGSVGQVPLLVISDRPFDDRPEDRIAHLGFPFHPDELFRSVQALLVGA